MAKNILQDIVPPEKRSIRNIPLPNRSTKREPIPETPSPKVKNSPAPVMPANTEAPKVYSYDEDRFSTAVSGKSKKGIWAGVVVAVLIVAFAVAAIFTSATVSISPRAQTVSVVDSVTFTAKRSATPPELPFELLTITKSAGKEVSASGEEKVERKASGSIIIYNDVDSAPQRLIKNTRFETSSGLIYRINESIVVPGKTTANGQSVPGSVEAVVYADEAGEKYNISKTDFTVPGFKSDPVRYKGIYARSKTEIGGGFVGVVKKVSEADQKNAEEALRGTLRDELLKESLAQVPEGFVLFDGASQISFSALPQSDDRGSSVTINQQGVLRGILFSKKALSQYIALQVAPDIAKGNVLIADHKTLAFTLKEPSLISADNLESVSFTLSGTASFISQFDEKVIKTDLAGKPERNLGTIMSNYPGVQSADSVIRPFWKGSFPKDTEDISIVIESR